MFKKIIKSLSNKSITSKKPIVDNSNDSGLNLQQKKAIEVRDSNILVLAGAGTGKTWTIISRVADLISGSLDGNGSAVAVEVVGGFVG